MISQETISMLKAMKMNAMAKTFEDQLKDSTYKALEFEERLGLLVTSEWNKRQSNKLNKYVKNAGFAIPSATVEGIEYYENRHLDKAQILRFATGRYIQEGTHIILMGMSGNGKTYIACALGKSACRQFKKVRYVRMPELLEEFKVAEGCGETKKFLTTCKKADLLIIDEWLIKPLSANEAYCMLEIMEQRCAQEPSKSIIFCTQYSKEAWYERLFSDPNIDSPISDAIMDRIIHNAYDVVIQGKESMRARHGIKAKEKQGGTAISK